MKRLLFLLLSLFVAITLVACGDNEKESEQNEEADVESEEVDTEPAEETADESEEEMSEVEEFVEENDVQLDEDGFYIETTDPLEAGDKNNGIILYDNEGELFIVKEWYTNDDTEEDGFNAVDFEGYQIKYAIALIENELEEDLVGVFAEVENGTEHELQFNDAFLFVTDTQDQTELEHGIQNNKPDTKSKFFNYAPLEYGTPEELAVEIHPPFADGESELVDVGEMVELEFTKE